MIAIADAIFTEVESDAVRRNGEVVRRALRGHCCDYVENKAEFASLLCRYAHEKLMAHHWKIRWDREWLRMNFHDTYGYYTSHTAAAKRLREQLKTIWPCSACIHLFNPTGRTRFPQLV